MSFLYIYGTVHYDGEVLKARKNRITRNVSCLLWSQWCPPYPDHRDGVQKGFRANP